MKVKLPNSHSVHVEGILASAMARSFGISSAVLLLTGCAVLPVAAPEDVVRERAESRWQALIAGDIEKAYGFLAPSYRAVYDLPRYRTMIGNAAQHQGAKVVGVECKPEVCTAKIRIEYTVPKFSGVYSTHYDEQWIVEQGGWWVYVKP
jgi:hypothetical protein